MHDLDHILFGDDSDDGGPGAGGRPEDLSPADRALLRRWSGLLGRVSSDVEAVVPDRRMLVLEGIRRYGGQQMLDEADVRALDASAVPLSDALARHPGLQIVVDDVREDAASFDRIWNEAVERDGENGVRRTRSADRAASAPKRVRPGFRWAARIATGAAVLTFAAVVFFLAQRDSGLATLATGPGETRLVELADGSTVRLLANSELAYRRAEDGVVFDRFTRLRGNAFFDVAPGREGFTIELPTAVVMVLGTSFGIQSDDQQARVYLATGRLSVSSPEARDMPVVLEPGQMTTISRDARPAAPTDTSMSEALDWTGLLVFVDTPMDKVSNRLSSVFGLDLRVDPGLQHETLTGTFERTAGADAVVEAVAAALGASVDSTGNSVRIRPR